MLARLSAHPNIVQFFGACVTPRPCLVLRFAAKGSLDDVLINKKMFMPPATDSLSPSGATGGGLADLRIIAQMAVDIAAGLTFLHGTNCTTRCSVLCSALLCSALLCSARRALSSGHTVPCDVQMRSRRSFTAIWLCETACSTLTIGV